MTGGPCGAMTSIEKLEAPLSRVLKPKKAGRKAKRPKYGICPPIETFPPGFPGIVTQSGV